MFKHILRPEAMLVAVLLMIIIMLVLPMPTWIIDIMIGFNMCVAFVLIMTALYLHKPLQFSSFPALLLMTTLFRLSLSVATTRQILLSGDAGSVVITFGQFVAGGNLAVGLVIFAILTLVQFLVITKGAERVAEVGARFSLDAMPGKQMAIDGDMRAGTIDAAGASAQRSNLEQESQFYGAMDGAMKFVKGDAIAGLIIVFVNLIGGVMIGQWQQGLPLSEALATYSVLTVGDGLVSQIPALLIAVSAGIIVTRVATAGRASNVGFDMISQLTSDPRAMVIAAVAIVAFGFVPGMPTATFSILGGGMGCFAARQMFRRHRSPDADGSHPGASDASQDGSAAEQKGAQQNQPGFSVPLMVEMGPGILERHSRQEIGRVLQTARQRINQKLGTNLSEIKLSSYPHADGANRYTISVHEVPLAHGEIRPAQLLLPDARQAQLPKSSLMLEPVQLRGLGSAPAWTDASHAETLAQLGVNFSRDLDILQLHLEWLISTHASSFLGVQETHILLESLATTYPDLVRELRRVLTEQRIAEVLQRLVSERISIRNLRAVAEALVLWAAKEKDVVVLTEYVRVALSHQISHHFTQGSGVLLAYLVSVELEETIRAAVRQTSGGNYLQLDTVMSNEIVDAVRSAIHDGAQKSTMAIVITSMEIRRYLKKLIERDIPWVEVLAYQELAPDVDIHPLGKITID